MAEKKITEVEVLNAVRALLDDEALHNDVIYYYDNKYAITEIMQKLDHMIEVRSRKHERKTDDSKRLANIALGEEFAANFKGETFKAADVAAALHVTTAKASAICKAMGWEKVPSSEKVLIYKL